MELGAVLRCSVCGAELSIIKDSSADLEPICCNTLMVAAARVNPVYYCTVCRAELMLITGDRARLEPRCCNRAMELKQQGLAC